jgi:hypothetical protein
MSKARGIGLEKGSFYLKVSFYDRHLRITGFNQLVAT